MQQPTVDYWVDAGWDPALHTYYGQVWASIDPTTHARLDDPLLSVGTRERQLTSVPQLRAALGPWAHLLDTDDLELELERAVVEDLVDEDDLDTYLATHPSTEQLTVWLAAHRQGIRPRQRDFASWPRPVAGDEVESRSLHVRPKATEHGRLANPRRPRPESLTPHSGGRAGGSAQAEYERRRYVHLPAK